MAGQRTTMAKFNREARVAQRRAEKQMRKEARKNGEVSADVSDEPESLDHLDRFTPSDFDGDSGLRRMESPASRG